MPNLLFCLKPVFGSPISSVASHAWVLSAHSGKNDKLLHTGPLEFSSSISFQVRRLHPAIETRQKPVEGKYRHK